MVSYRTRFSALLLLLCLSFTVRSQVSILSSNLNSLNVIPLTLCQVNIMSQKSDAKVILEAVITNASNEEVLKVRTLLINLKNGFNSGMSLPVSIESAHYSSSPQGSYVKTNKALPSGNFKYCVRLIGDGNDYLDEFCQDISAQMNAYLTLVSPFDRDTISTPNPVLCWNHSEPFNILSTGEFFRMVVTEKNRDQNTESAVEVNSPVFIKDRLTSHNIPYPFDAKVLLPGKKYAWQVQKISNSVIIDKTEAWEFTLAKKEPVPEVKYAVLQRTLSSGFYTAANKKVYFRFDEDYTSGKVKCFIYDEKHKAIDPIVKNENSDAADNGGANVKMNGYNRFEVDAGSLGLQKGYYTMEVFNEKNEKFLLKFYVE